MDFPEFLSWGEFFRLENEPAKKDSWGQFKAGMMAVVGQQHGKH